MRFCEVCERGQRPDEGNWTTDTEGMDYCPDCAIPLMRTNLGQLQEFARWIVSMDDPDDVTGREERRQVTFARIADRARESLGDVAA